MGSRGNANVEIVVINNIFEILSTGPVDEGDLKKSISEVFNKISDWCFNLLYEANFVATIKIH